MIALKNVSISYPNAKEIISNVSLEINEKLCFLLGKNGAGKSSFLKFLSKTEHFTTTGNYSLFSKNSTSFKQRDLSKKISLLMQESVSTDIYVKDIYSISKNFSNDTFNDNFTQEIKKKFTISELDNCNFNNLSGGEKQKILLTAFFILNSDIMLFDEPFSAIDFSSVPVFIAILNDYFPNKQKIVSVHDLNYIYNKDVPILFIENRSITQYNNLLEFIKSETYKNNYPNVGYEEINGKIHFTF